MKEQDIKDLEKFTINNKYTYAIGLYNEELIGFENIEGTKYKLLKNANKDDKKRYFANRLLIGILKNTAIKDTKVLKKNIVSFFDNPRIVIKFNKSTTQDEMIDLMLKFFFAKYEMSDDFIKDPSQYDNIKTK